MHIHRFIILSVHSRSSLIANAPTQHTMVKYSHFYTAVDADTVSRSRTYLILTQMHWCSITDRAGLFRKDPVRFDSIRFIGSLSVCYVAHRPLITVFENTCARTVQKNVKVVFLDLEKPIKTQKRTYIFTGHLITPP